LGKVFLIEICFNDEFVRLLLPRFFERSQTYEANQRSGFRQMHLFFNYFRKGSENLNLIVMNRKGIKKEKPLNQMVSGFS